MDGHREVLRAKNGPALAGHGAEAVRDAIAATITTLPERLRKSLTWDRVPRWRSTVAEVPAHGHHDDVTRPAVICEGRAGAVGEATLTCQATVALPLGTVLSVFTGPGI